ncbi:MAG TPA: BTAD domain-containing putative transcriptional regulator [Roseiflexaceae bacterium]|nr:BTAD domain-containing putative transcriptional regulator [Roseiflexaceae bacterium]
MTDTAAAVPAQQDAPSNRLEIRLFGGLDIAINGVAVTDIATRKAEALLVYLACNRRPHQREALADLLWDDLPPERAAGNLRLALTQLRKRCDPFLDVSRQTVALRSDASCWLDLDAFAALTATQPPNPEALRQAVELYRGDLLRGFHLRDAQGFSAWQETQAEHWRQQTAGALQALVAHAVAWSSYPEGITWAKRLLDLDPLDEAAHRQLMLLYARSGQRNAAARQYAACKRIVRQELELEPDADTEALYQRIRRMPERRPHNLPPGGLLVGRRSEQARIAAWLVDPDARLLTVVGPGGSGKTQLGLSAGRRVAQEHLGPCGDGVCYVALLGDAWNNQRIDAQTLLPALAGALAGTLGVRWSPKGALDEQIAQQLRDKELLLILDNAELLDQTARQVLSALVQRLPPLRLLALSRERLKLKAEHVLSIAGLAFPEASGPAATARPALGVDLAQYESVQLLLACAGRLQGPSTLERYSAAEQAAIGLLCRMVHGLPLAIELLAPWLRLRLPSEIARDIGRDLDLLAADLPELPARHRSLRAAFDYSWNLIGQGEHAALARLTCFPGSFSAAAAGEAAGVALPALAALYDASLVQMQADETGTRYLLHPLLRQLVRERWQHTSGLLEQTQARHAAFFAEQAAQSEDRLRGPQGPELLAALEREIDNLRVGWQWAIDQRRIDLLGQYSVALHDFFTIRSWEIEGHLLFSAAARMCTQLPPAEQTAEQRRAVVRVLSCHAQLEQLVGDLDAAERSLHLGREILGQHAPEHQRELIFLSKQLGLIAYGRGAYAEALAHLRHALTLAQSGTEPSKLGDILLSAAAVLCAQGSWADAEQTVRRCLDCYEAADFTWGIGHAQRFAGMCALGQGRLDEARHRLEHSLEIARSLGSHIGEALALDQIGLLELRENRVSRSQHTFEQALAIYEELGVDLGIGRAHCHLGRAALALDNQEQAERYFRQALGRAQRIAATPLLVEAAAGLLQLRLLAAGQTEATMALRRLLCHPACTAETRAAHSAPLRLDRSELPVPGADARWMLEQICALALSDAAELALEAAAG